MQNIFILSKMIHIYKAELRWWRKYVQTGRNWITFKSFIFLCYKRKIFCENFIFKFIDLRGGCPKIKLQKTKIAIINEIEMLLCLVWLLCLLKYWPPLPWLSLLSNCSKLIYFEKVWVWVTLTLRPTDLTKFQKSEFIWTL